MVAVGCLLFASDIHGHAAATRKLVKQIERFDPENVLLLGDILYHGPRNELPEGYDTLETAALLNSFAERTIAVLGNCDAEVDSWLLEFPSTKKCIEFEFDERLFLLTHGHREFCTPGDHTDLPDGAVFCSGHTHVKVLEAFSNHYLLNPSSVGIPKDGCASFAVYEKGSISLYDLDGNTLKTLTL